MCHRHKTSDHMLLRFGLKYFPIASFSRWIPVAGRFCNTVIKLWVKYFLNILTFQVELCCMKRICRFMCEVKVNSLYGGYVSLYVCSAVLQRLSSNAQPLNRFIYNTTLEYFSKTAWQIHFAILPNKKSYLAWHNTCHFYYWEFCMLWYNSVPYCAFRRTIWRTIFAACFMLKPCLAYSLTLNKGAIYATETYVDFNSW
jgi:hypothetical protein